MFHVTTLVSVAVMAVPVILFLGGLVHDGRLGRQDHPRHAMRR